MPVSEQEALRITRVLEEKLDRRQANIREWNRFYKGEENLAYASDRFRAAFGGLFDEFSDNWSSVVCDAPAERMTPVGFRFGPTDGQEARKADATAQRFWQGSSMDAWARIAHLESMVKSRSFLLVWAEDPTDNETEPEITVEDATQCIVEYEPGNRRRRKWGLKRFFDDDGYAYATLYLRDQIWKWRRARVNSGLILPSSLALGSGWHPRDDQAVIPNPLGRVPLLELVNKARLVDDPTPEHRIVMPLQRAANKLIVDMLTASEAGAFPARWGSGIDLPKDPRTGQEIDDPELWRLSVSKMLRASNPQARFGSFEAADLRNFAAGITLLIEHISSLSRTPPTYFMGKVENVSADTLTASEAGLVSKTRDKTLFAGETWEEAARLCFLVKNDTKRGNDPLAETIWAPVEYRTEAQHVDAVAKKKSLGVPWRQLMEDLGYTPTQITRMEAMLEADTARAARALAFQPLDDGDGQEDGAGAEERAGELV
ncbi:phage portal protein [Streptomyces sp. t39]|uniref:phage portal protein n=1 Tax=Streptomyces sp. t39 TaxID=1828156 RepID=UPI0011CDC32C|nr:phage portal protein [Streptomyces sp. t39]TXS35365.1 phage portal protein [Streptomyces sp. t39]